MLGPNDVGHRVVLRRIIGIRENRPLLTDTIGILAALDGTALLLEADSGVPLRVALTDLVAGKRVPPRRVTAAGQIAALERAASLAWPAAEHAELGQWELRYAAGWTGRANSALAIGDPGRSLPVALDAVIDWYTQRGLPPRINVPLPLGREVDTALHERGWTTSPVVLVQTAALRELPRPRPDRPVVTLGTEPGPDWLAMLAGVKGAVPSAGRVVLTGPPQTRFASLRDGAGQLLAIGRGAVTERRLHLSLLQVAGAARRRGLATQVLAALVAWAEPLAAHTGYLQVEATNTGAVALYERLGFATHHTYHSRTAPGAGRGTDSC